MVQTPTTQHPWGTPEDRRPDDAQGTMPQPLSKQEPMPEATSAAERRRDEARKILEEKKRGWQSAMVAYVVVNAFLVGIWAMTGGGYFWPAWPLGGWGLAMVLSFWDIYVRKPITEEDIDAELRRR